MVDSNFEENVKEAFKSVKEDITSVKQDSVNNKDNIKQIKDKISLLMEKIDKLELKLGKKDENGPISYGKTKISSGNDGVHNNNNTKQQQHTTTLSNKQQQYDTKLDKLLKSITHRQLSVLMAIHKLEGENGSATHAEIVKLLNMNSSSNIRQYTMELVNKNLIYNRKIIGNTSHFYINKALMDKNTIDKLLKLNFGPNTQKTLFDE